MQVRNPLGAVQKQRNHAAKFFNSDCRHLLFAVVTGHAHALDSEDVAASPGVTPAEVTNAAKQAAIAEGSGR